MTIGLYKDMMFVLVKPDVSEKHIASFFGEKYSKPPCFAEWNNGEDGGDMFLPNVGSCKSHASS
jgi:hypothetical protein